MAFDLALAWMLVIGFAVMMYIIMDGFDLGIGILFPFVREREHRDTMVNTVAPVWDGNETWLVLGGAGLLAAFPKAYAVLLTSFYIPLLLMLVGLIWRGVSFEFRFKADESHKPFWDKAFISGSVVAAFFQGAALGAFIEGIELVDGRAAAGVLDWFSPFSILTGCGVVLAYSLLGATWLILKTEGELQRTMKRVTRPITLGMLGMIAVVSLWSPFIHPSIADRWFGFPHIVWFAPVPVLVLAAAWMILHAIRRPGDPGATPFLCALLLIFLGYSGFVISIWPNIVPHSLSIWQAAAPEQSLGFTLVGALLIIPVILGYSGWSYYVFRGKVKAGEGYH
ncbi:MAG: cytochrome d ubiquinol oxidase subunit II [Burkholderiaceae bacterium]